jgi:YfiH family protein
VSDLAQRVAAAGLDWIVAAVDGAPGVQALVTTRNGGACAGERATLDLGPASLVPLDAAARACIEENRRRVARFLPGAPVWLEQVHGCGVAVVDAVNVGAFRAVPPRADAAVTRLPGVPLAVRVADCLPIVIGDAAGSVVGVAHAGWRGLAAGVVEATVAAAAVAPASLSAWLGPSIGRGAFEVGDDVRDAFAGVHAADAVHFRAHLPGKWLADLPALARARLRRAGVEAVASLDVCTHADAARFFSWRRDRTSARFAAFAWR